MRIIALILLLQIAAPAAAFERALCRGSASSEAYDCLSGLLQNVDARLTEMFNEVTGQLDKTSPSDAAKLRRAQRAWLVFRDADCEFAGFADSGAQEKLVSQAACLLNRSEKRIDELVYYTGLRAAH